MTRIVALLLATASLSVACSAQRPAAEGSESDQTQARSSSSSGGATITNDDDAGSTADDAGESDAGNADVYTPPPPPPPSVCNPELVIGSATRVAGLPDHARFAGITRDELTIAYTTVSEEGIATLFAADRASVTEDFGAAQNVGNYVANDGVSISDDGLEILAVTADRKTFSVFTRPTVDDDFAVGDDSAYDNVSMALADGETLADPVVARSGLVIVYSVFGGSADTMRLAQRISNFATFDPTDTLAFDQFKQVAATRRHPTGTGDDFNTIFYWDEASMTEKLARLNGSESIVSTKDLGRSPWAAPNANCDGVYFGDDGVFRGSGN